MLNSSEIISPSERQVLAALSNGMQTWKDIKSRTRLDDERLGVALAKLFNQRKLRTGYRGDERIYIVRTPPKN
ncbi:MAG: hypothetical protein WKF84_02750 [Pyrinomonadaceae bacterium]